ncbi:hypothetical protein ENBRE01_1367 [Enteropsectra breve]|nr:hypothetical protein ENBRE01_1367 [Enteropsectra breve]
MKKLRMPSSKTSTPKPAKKLSIKRKSVAANGDNSSFVFGKSAADTSENNSNIQTNISKLLNLEKESSFSLSDQDSFLEENSPKSDELVSVKIGGSKGLVLDTDEAVKSAAVEEGHSRISAKDENWCQSSMLKTRTELNSDLLRPETDFSKLISDEFKGNTSINSSRVITQSMRMTENPFDLFSGNVYKELKKKVPDGAAQKDVEMDTAILGNLKKSKKHKSQPLVEKRIGIFRKLQFFTDKEISIPIKKYYKFPSFLNLKNDDSEIFKLIIGEYITAISTVYSNYRKFKEGFIVKYEEGLVLFGDSVLVSLDQEKMLKNNDIQYERSEGWLKICRDDVALLYDVIVNVDLNKGAYLPFILSEYEFDNAIVYHTKVEQGIVIKTGSLKEYAYTLVGPLYACDFLKNIEAIQIKYID